MQRGLHLALVTALGLLLGLPLAGQSRKGEVELRTVHGIVLDSKESSVPSSVIYLMNVRTQAIKTYIADASGNYRFSGLDPNVDYEIHAEYDDMTSSTRTISSFDSNRDIEIVLKLSHKKSGR
jgi:hypothetical protein